MDKKLYFDLYIRDCDDDSVDNHDRAIKHHDMIGNKKYDEKIIFFVGTRNIRCALFLRIKAIY